MPGSDSINSTSSLGGTNITLQFDLSRNIDAAAQDVQSMIAKDAAATAAADADAAVVPEGQPGRSAGGLAGAALADPADLDGRRVCRVDDGAADLDGERALRRSESSVLRSMPSASTSIRSKLSAHGIGLDELATAIQSGNANLPTGTMFGPNTIFTVLADGQLMKADQNTAPMVIAYRNGNAVKLDEVAHVYDGVEADKQASYLGGLRTVTLAIMKQPGTNVVQVVDDVKSLLPTFREQLPPAVQLDVRADRSASIRDSVQDVKFTLLLTIGLVVAVIFFFLRNMSATVIPSLALPASLVATFGVMYLLDYSLDNLSLMALTLSVGFVVDDAIVMLENIVRHMEMGKAPMRAAFDGSAEISFTIISMTISLAAVFIPVLFMGGIVGRLLHEFSVTIAVAILVSGLVSISLTPMLCSRFLKPPHSQKHGWFYKATERMFDTWLRGYDRSLRWSLAHRVVVMAISIALMIGTVFLFTRVPTGFLPTEDQGRLIINVEAKQGIGYEEMTRHMFEVSDIVSHDPDISAYTTNVGSATGAGMNNGRLIIDLKPRAERKRSVQQIVADLRPKLAQVVGVQVFPNIPASVNLGGQQNARSLYQFTLQDTDTDELYRTAPAFEKQMQQMPGLVDVSSDLLVQNPQIRIHMDRGKISALGLTINQIETALYNAYGTRQVSQIYAASNQYQVILQVEPEFQMNPAALSSLYVRSSNGRLIPLNTVASVTTDLGPSSVSHTGQLPSVTISFNLRDGYSLGDAVSTIRAAAAATLPSTMTTTFQGSAQAFQDSLKGLGIILLMAIVVIYIVLGILYESFTHPLTILSGLPSAGFGALLTLLIFRTELSLYAFVGIIMLVGLVKKNGIMMVDFAVEAQREHGKTPLEAIHEACLVRFRPITMTTFAALVGTLPIALGFGAGAESRRPLGLAVVGGLMVSQLLTLYITPVYYVYIEQARLRLARRRSTTAAIQGGLDSAHMPASAPQKS